MSVVGLSGALERTRNQLSRSRDLFTKIDNHSKNLQLGQILLDITALQNCIKFCSIMSNIQIDRGGSS